jgi:hypothetical protein
VTSRATVIRRHCIITDIRPKLLRMIAGNLTAVKIVEMDSGTLSGSTALDIAPHFPALMILSLRDHINPYRPIHPVVPLRQCQGFQVQIIDLVYDVLGHTVKWLLTHDPIPMIHTLRCFACTACNDSGRLRNLPLLLEAAGRNIETLEIHLNPFPNYLSIGRLESPPRSAAN